MDEQDATALDTFINPTVPAAAEPPSGNTDRAGRAVMSAEGSVRNAVVHLVAIVAG